MNWQSSKQVVIFYFFCASSWGRAEGLTGTEGGRRYHHGVAIGPSTALSADVSSDICREELNHHFSTSDRAVVSFDEEIRLHKTPWFAESSPCVSRLLQPSEAFRDNPPILFPLFVLDKLLCDWRSIQVFETAESQLLHNERYHRVRCLKHRNKFTVFSYY